MIIAGVGILINGVPARLFILGRKGDLNIKAAYLHTAADAGLAAGVVVAGLLIVLTGNTWIDPIMSLIIVLVIAVGTWGLLRDPVNMGLQAAPPGLVGSQIKEASLHWERLCRARERHFAYLCPLIPSSALGDLIWKATNSCGAG